MLLICLLTFSIHLIGALAYAARRLGARYKRFTDASTTSACNLFPIE